jgi:hypothetical protein
MLSSFFHAINFNPHVENMQRTRSVKWAEPVEIVQRTRSVTWKTHVEVFIITAWDSRESDSGLRYEEYEDKRIGALTPYVRCSKTPKKASKALNTKDVVKSVTSVSYVSKDVMKMI